MMPRTAMPCCTALAVLAFAVAAAPALAKERKMPKPAEIGSLDQGGVYRMSAEEQGYDCKKLTGRIQIRILQIKSAEATPGTSQLSRSLQQGSQAVFGGSTHGINKGQQLASDRAMIEAYNKALVAKNCKSFDLNAALAQPGFENPQPTVAQKDPSKKPEKSRLPKLFGQ